MIKFSILKLNTLKGIIEENIDEINLATQMTSRATFEKKKLVDLKQKI